MMRHNNPYSTAVTGNFLKKFAKQPQCNTIALWLFFYNFFVMGDYDEKKESDSFSHSVVLHGVFLFRIWRRQACGLCQRRSAEIFCTVNS
jgi:hypothetical protein